MQTIRTVLCLLLTTFAPAWAFATDASKEVSTESRTSLTYGFTVQAARDALNAGLPGIAKDLFHEALASDHLPKDQATRNNLRLGLVSALLASGEVQEAKAQLEKLDQKDSDHADVTLRRAMIAFLERDLPNLKRWASLLQENEINESERDWAAFLKSMATLPEEESNIHFENALRLARNANRQIDFKLLKVKEELLRTGGSEVLAANLKRQMEEFRGKEASKEFLIQYVMVLHSIGKNKDALMELESQLKKNGNKLGNWRDRLLLLYGMIGDFSDTATRSALESLIEQGSSREYMEIALHLLVSKDSDISKNADFIDKLLAAPNNPLTEFALSVRLRLALEQNDNQMAETTARRIMEEFPASPRKPEALRSLAAAAWRSSPPKYLLVADFLSQLRNLMELREEKEELGVQIADCRFLAKDYSGSAALYLELYRESTDPSLHGRALYQAINCQLALNDLNEALSLLNEFPESNESQKYRWSAEWNFILNLKERGQEAKALSRIDALLESAGASMPPLSRVRMSWLKSALSLQAGKPESAEAIADATLQWISNNTNFPKEIRDSLDAKLRLTKGRAQYDLNDMEGANETFVQLRIEHANSDESAFSYLVEANHYAADNRLDEAQRSLLHLVDQHKSSAYAPVALYEASIHLERRGLDKNLKEGIDLLERLTKDYPNDRLVFYARQRQANLLRKRNEFGPALELCEDLLSADRFRTHPARHAVMLIRADCILALAREDRQKIIEASEVYAELKRMSDKPMSFRSEAAYKQGVALRRMGKPSEAEKVYFRDVEIVLLKELQKNRQDGKELASGRYWLARSLLDLGEMLEAGDRTRQAVSVYQKILAYGLPGGQLALGRISVLKGPEATEGNP